MFSRAPSCSEPDAMRCGAALGRQSSAADAGDLVVGLRPLLRTTGHAGGKGGGLRLSLLMSLIWVTARAPYTTSRVAPYWAELLGRDDPQEAGARAIRDALHDLADRGFIQLRSAGRGSKSLSATSRSPRPRMGRPTRT